MLARVYIATVPNSISNIKAFKVFLKTFLFGLNDHQINNLW